jgi:hypothetical protein
MEYEMAKKTRDALEDRLRFLSAKLKAIGAGSGNMGLTSDRVKSSPEYKALKQESAETFSKIQFLNTLMVKKFKKEVKRDRKFK